MPNVYDSLLHIPYYSIALVELANETAAEQACSKLSEMLVINSIITSLSCVSN